MRRPGTWKSEGYAVPVILTTPVNSTVNPEERSCDTRGSSCFHKFRKDLEMGLAEGRGGWVGKWLSCPSDKLQFTWREGSLQARSLSFIDLQTTFPEIVI